MAADLDGLLRLIGAAVAGAGLMLAAWALFRDRAKRRGILRRRCPGCWYDMGGVPGLTCPECGRASATEKRLHRTRRRWWSATAGAALVALGLAVIAVPAWRAGGWIALVPSSILIFAAPPEQPTPPARPAGLIAISPGTGGSAFTLGPARALPVVQAPLETRLCDTAWARLQAGKLWTWQAELFLGRVARQNQVDHPWIVTHLHSWPVGIPLRVLIQPTTGFRDLSQQCVNEFWIEDGASVCTSSYPTEAMLATLTAPSRPGGGMTLHYRMKASGATVARGSIPLPIDVVPDAASVVRGDSTPELTAAVREALSPELTEEDGVVGVIVSDRSRSPPWSLIGALVAYEVEIRLDGAVLGRAQGWSEPARPVWKNWEVLRMTWEAGGLEQLRSAPDRAEIRIAGRPELAADLYLSSAPVRLPTENRCWTGEFTVPALWGDAWRPAPPGEPAPAHEAGQTHDFRR